ncbi:MAG TPA: hypothetical protein DEA08_16005 [Planctomycetes bacterium]|nr:hypothetical protein [Planctomycetota bacterium]
MTKKKVKKRRKAPRGSGLSWDPRREKWLWRRVDKRTGRRRVRSTDQRRLDLAMRVAARFDDELAQEQAGLKVYDCWRLELEPLVTRWQGHQVSSARAAELKAKRVRRALELLKLRTAADLADVAKLDDRLRALEGRQLGRMTVSRARLRDSFQNPLKAFSRWLAGNGRHLPHDPLAVWEPIPLRAEDKAAKRPRRSAYPHELARAFRAVELLDGRRNRVAQVLLWKVLLVAGPRAGALYSRDVRHLHVREVLEDGELVRVGWIDLGAGVGNKRKGAAELDAATTEELLAFLGDRERGPLLPSPTGSRWRRERALDSWREAFGLALLDELWPSWAPADLELALKANRSLLSGRLRLFEAGNPGLGLTDATKRGRVEAREQVEQLVADLGEECRTRMIDAASLRKTHGTWAEAKGVPGVAIDKQLGHRAQVREADVFRAIARSQTGRSHYLDLDSQLFDARLSARAVRELLDQAVAELEAVGTPLLFAGRSASRGSELG